MVVAAGRADSLPAWRRAVAPVVPWRCRDVAGPGRGSETIASTTDIGALLMAWPQVRGGRAQIAGTGVTVLRLAGWYRQGLRAEEIAAGVPHLSLAQIYAALTSSLANRDEIDR